MDYKKTKKQILSESSVGTSEDYDGYLYPLYDPHKLYSDTVMAAAQWITMHYGDDYMEMFLRDMEYEEIEKPKVQRI